MLKNLDLKTLLASKTFWAGLVALFSGATHAYGQWASGNKASAVTEFGLALSAFLGAVGIKDATSGPVN